MNIIIDKQRKIPVYLQLKEQIENYILSESLPEGHRLPDVKTIAKLGKISIRTADLGLQELVKEGICFRLPKKGTFVADKSKQAKLKKICMIYYQRDNRAMHSDLVQSSLFYGLSLEAEANSIDLLYPQTSFEENMLFYTENNDFDTVGVIVTNCQKLDDITCLAKKFPSLTFNILNYQFKGFEETPDNVHGVFNDDFGGAYQIMEHLIRQGRLNVRLISIDQPNENYVQRLEGFQTALKHNKINTDRKIKYSTSRKQDESQQMIGYKMAEKIIKEDPETSAIACVNDLLAEGVCVYLRESGLRKKIKVTGYDNIIEDISLNNNFSTLMIDFERIGQKAIESLNDHDTQYPKQIRIQPKLIVRDQ